VDGTTAPIETWFHKQSCPQRHFPPIDKRTQHGLSHAQEPFMVRVQPRCENRAALHSLLASAERSRYWTSSRTYADVWIIVATPILTCSTLIPSHSPITAVEDAATLPSLPPSLLHVWTSISHHLSTVHRQISLRTSPLLENHADTWFFIYPTRLLHDEELPGSARAAFSYHERKPIYILTSLSLRLTPAS
jgi:hypothetical protein